MGKPEEGHRATRFGVGLRSWGYGLPESQKPLGFSDTTLKLRRNPQPFRSPGVCSLLLKDSALKGPMGEEIPRALVPTLLFRVAADLVSGVSGAWGCLGV